jgi:hypothetical protein
LCAVVHHVTIRCCMWKWNVICIAVAAHVATARRAHSFADDIVAAPADVGRQRSCQLHLAVARTAAQLYPVAVGIAEAVHPYRL